MIESLFSFGQIKKSKLVCANKNGPKISKYIVYVFFYVDLCFWIIIATKINLFEFQVATKCVYKNYLFMKIIYVVRIAKIDAKFFHMMTFRPNSN